MKPFFPRLGGKYRLAKKLVPLFLELDTYCEPFLGAGSCFLFKKPSPVEIISDNDRDIIDMWGDVRTIKIDGVDELTNSREVFTNYLKAKYTDPTKRFWRNLFLSKFSYAGNRINYAPCRKKATLTWFKKNLADLKERLNDVTILCCDFMKIIREYDSKNSFFFLDPPYCSGATHLWSYKPSTPESLRDVLRSIKGKFLMTYECTENTKKIFEEFNLLEVSTKYTTSRKGPFQKTELVIMNYVPSSYPPNTTSKILEM